MVHIKNLKVKSIKCIFNIHFFFIIVHPSSRNPTYAPDGTQFFKISSLHINQKYQMEASSITSFSNLQYVCLPTFITTLEYKIYWWN